MTTGDLVLSISKDQALVLFEFLSRSDEADGFLFEDEAEQRVVWLLQAQLERQLSEPLQADYLERLRHARDTVRGSPSSE